MSTQAMKDGNFEIGDFIKINLLMHADYQKPEHTTLGKIYRVVAMHEPDAGDNNPGPHPVIFDDLGNEDWFHRTWFDLAEAPVPPSKSKIKYEALF